MAQESAVRKEDALSYHSMGRKGKIEIIPTKPVSTVRDLSLAYSPGVAYPCLEIAADISKVYEYTSRGNVVAVISNGTAVLGLGNIGPEASKPVMEGKAILFKKYADIDGVDIEIRAEDPDEFIRVVKALEPSFGGINLEDVKAPECFEIERRLKEVMRIPLMHDDQHGTAIISAAALVNALEITGRKIEETKMLVSGAGAAAVSCVRMYFAMGLKPENLIMLDRNGVIHIHRDDLDDIKREFATHRTDIKGLADAFAGMDVFVGLSKGNIVTPEMLRQMNPNPIIFALANPDPEISYDLAMQTRPDAIMATGRSDYPNQVNNVLGFPYIFRGALDVRATEINEAMKLAAARAIAALAHEPVPEAISQIYQGKKLQFGKEYLIPKPMDPRLLVYVSTAVAKAAINSGVAHKPITDWDKYREELETRMGLNKGLVRQIIAKAQSAPKKVVFPEADNFKILKAAQMLIDEKIAEPILLGNRERILGMIKEYEIEIPNPTIIYPSGEIELRRSFAQKYFERRKRKGVTYLEAVRLMRDRNYFGMMMVQEGLADALLTGATKNYPTSLHPALELIGRETGVKTICGLYILNTKKEILFFADCTINKYPTVENLVEIARLTARAISYFGVEPRIAMLSYSNFGSNRDEVATRMMEATKILQNLYPDLLVDGDIQANIALRPDLMQEFFPFNKLAQTGANTFIFPELSAANISYKLIQEIAQADAVGPIILGMNKPVHILQMGSSVREIVNMASFAVVNAQTGNEYF